MKLLITGITGTLGQELLKIASNDASIDKIIGISRDEQKQRAISNDKLIQRLCDIRDLNTVAHYMAGADVVYHCAALKCVDTLEDNPFEALQTNVLGTKNLISAAKADGVTKFVMASTDKAAFPINIYGVAKAAAEKLVIASGYTVCRYGNVIGSRGSVVPLFVKAIQSGKPLPITSVDMTRFWIRIEDAAKFIYEKGMYGESGLFFPPMKAARIVDVAAAIAAIMGKYDYPIEIVGIRKGEKLHECIDTGEYGINGQFSNTVDQYTDEELVALLRASVEKFL